jgi:hypothetical protein
MFLSFLKIAATSPDAKRLNGEADVIEVQVDRTQPS